MSTTVNALVLDPACPENTGVRTIADDLATLQGLVGGYLEAVYGYRNPDGTDDDRPRITFYLNEEGKIHDLPRNGSATALWWHYDPDAIGRDVLVGPVVIVGGHDQRGHNTDLPGDVTDTYLRLVTGDDHTGVGF